MKFNIHNFYFVEKHIRFLREIRKSIDFDAIDLFLKLNRLEKKGQRLALNYNNGVLTLEQFNEKSDKLIKSLKKLINNNFINDYLIINSDSRGNFFLIKDTYVKMLRERLNFNVYTNMGGYGVLVPDFS